jgi:putative membrane protein
MKKFTVSIFLLFALFVSVPAFAAVVTQPVEPQKGEKVYVTIKEPTTSTLSPIKITPSTNNIACPMMQGGAGMMNGGGCPMMQGGKVLMTNNPQNGNRFFMKFRSNQERGQHFNRGPKAFMWIGMGIKFVAFLLFWILLIVLLVMLIKWIMKPHDLIHCCKNDSSLEILKERLAKGEITSEQYDELKAKLS